jgi:hypothetical protein
LIHGGNYLPDDDREVEIARIEIASIIRSAFVHIKINQQMMERLMPVTWNHRVLLIEEHGEKSYCIHEVHYDNDGSILGWTENAIAVCSMRRSIIC